MATKKTEKPEETTLAQPAAPTTPEAAEETKVTQAAPAPCEAEVMESLDELAQRHRVPGWQLGALLRFMGWEADRQVNETDFVAALGLLSGRPLGGGRR